MKHSPCTSSPTGAHHYVMGWPEPGVYQGVCRYCGHVKREDATLVGLGRGHSRAYGQYATRNEAVGNDTPEEENMDIPQFPKGQGGNLAKGRFYAAHIDEIRRDIATIGREATAAKWGMSLDWTYRQVPAGQKRKARETIRPEARPLTARANNTHSLPSWSDDWSPEVQIEWLRCVVEMARIETLK